MHFALFLCSSSSAVLGVSAVWESFLCHLALAQTRVRALFTKLPEVNLPSTVFESIRHYSPSTKSFCVINIAALLWPHYYITTSKSNNQTVKWRWTDCLYTVCWKVVEILKGSLFCCGSQWPCWMLSEREGQREREGGGRRDTGGTQGKKGKKNEKKGEGVRRRSRTERKKLKCKFVNKVRQ